VSKPLLPPEEFDDFIIIRARAFTSTVRREMTRELLNAENLAILEWQLLFSVARFGSCHLAYVTQKTSIDPAHGSRAAAALEKKGLITRKEDPENKRRKLISLTDDGVGTFNRVWPKARQVTRTLTDRLNTAELEELKRLLDILNAKEEPQLDHKKDAKKKTADPV
jgi:DNA-binding MarR family transcriptional regulator